MPYEKVCLMVAMVVTVLLTAMMSHNFAEDARVTVIDMDNTRYSHEIIDRINASEYMKVTAVLNNAVNPEALCYRDQAVAVVYLPQGLEKNRYSNSDAAIGVFYDNTSTSWSAEIKEALNEIVAIDQSQAAAARGAAAEWAACPSSSSRSWPSWAEAVPWAAASSAEAAEAAAAATSTFPTCRAC